MIRDAGSSARDVAITEWRNSMNKDAFPKYIEAYGRDVYSFCRYLTRESFDADDLYQQTFLVAFEKNELDESLNPKSYLITIAANLWKNKKRKQRIREKKANIIFLEDNNFGEPSDDSPDALELVIKDEEAEAVRGLVQRLPDKLRIVLLMYYTEEMKLEEISEALSIPLGTVKSRMNKAKKLIKERLSYER